MRVNALICAALVAVSAWGNDFLHSLPTHSALLPGYESTDSVEMRMGELPLCPVEGVWQMASGGALFAIERAEPSTELAPSQMRLVIMRSPWRTIRPGTIAGHLTPTARPGTYEARLYTSFAHRTGLDIPRSFTLEVNGDMLVIKPMRSPLKINLFRMLPYMFRRGITLQSSRPEGLDGAVRVFPASAAHPLSPVYL